MKDYEEELLEEKDPDEEKGGGDAKPFIIGLLTGVLCMCIVLFLIIIVSDNKYNKKVEETGLDTKSIAAKLEAIEELFKENSDGSANIADMIEGIYAGFVANSGDKYAKYYSAEEYKEVKEGISGQYEGIGIRATTNENGIVMVYEVFKDSPAEKAGLLAGDLIYKVDGTEVVGADLDTVIAMVKGEKDTSVRLTILRGETTFDVDVTRAEISTPSVDFKMIDEENKIGYIYISKFEIAGLTQFTNAVDSLQAQGMRKLIIDLRDNTGGEVTVTVAMLDRLLPEGVSLITEDFKGNKEESTSDAENYIDVPIVVLTNEYTASASELFAGALKDYGMAETVGTKTYGKGVVQTIYSLGDGSHVKLTMAKYYTPKGICVDGVGIAPDYEVKYEYDANNPNYDNQLEKAKEVLLAK